MRASLAALAVAISMGNIPGASARPYPARPVTLVVPFSAGGPGLYIAIWHGIWVPRGTPRKVIAKLNAAAVEALSDASVRARLADLGQELPPREQQAPEALGAFHKAEIEKWWPLIKAAGIKAD
jgi:tripartite-type tricarboxylate transporter receptor subunit TctC